MSTSMMRVNVQISLKKKTAFQVFRLSLFKHTWSLEGFALRWYVVSLFCAKPMMQTLRFPRNIFLQRQYPDEIFIIFVTTSILAGLKKQMKLGI